MNPIIFIDSNLSETYSSPLFEMFSSEIQSFIPLSGSLLKYTGKTYPIFTNITPHITNFVYTKNLKQYGLILDGKFLNKIIDKEMMINADFVYIIGKFEDKYANFLKSIKARTFTRIIMQIKINNDSKYIFCENKYINKLYEDIIQNKIVLNGGEKIYIIHDKNEKLYESYNYFDLKYEYICPTPAMFSWILSNHKKIFSENELFKYYLEDSSEGTSAKSFLEILKNDLSKVNFKTNNRKKKINIVCFKPSYLFQDLVNRFKAAGCIHSDFPQSDADSYIWMRPQEIWHYEYLSKGINNSEIKQSYINSFKKISDRCNIDDIKKQSLAIHHGTCYNPLYQFCPTKLAYSLYDLYKVIGVCEFEECYGPSSHIANKNNFVFFPIGYDDKLFLESHINLKTRTPESILKIGVVGRAYGTTNKELLVKSILGEPYGYRKGGDLILDIALRLKSLNIPIELHIIGANWETLISDLENYGIYVKYYERDENITYKEFPIIYTKFDVLFIASRCEGGPVSALEAMSMGVPVISTNVGICKFLENNIHIKNAISCFNYDRKWNIYDKKYAIQLLLNIYRSTHTYEDRMKIRNSIKHYTTDAWVQYICNTANEI